MTKPHAELVGVFGAGRIFEERRHYAEDEEWQPRERRRDRKVR